MLQNVLIVKLAKIVHCELHVFFFSFVHAPVCANCKSDSCNIYSKKKKQKKNKKENDPYFGMGEKHQSYATKTLLSIFSLGKGREYLRLQTLHKKKKKLSKVRFLPCPQHANHSDSDTVWMTHAKINKN